MNAIILPGESKQSNKQWVKNLGRALQSQFEETTVIDYDHWNSATEVNFDQEKSKLERIIQNMTEPYAIIAKSMGTAIAATLITEEKARPEYCVFAGLPLQKDETSKYELETALKGYNIPTIILQNQDERFIKPEQLRAILAKLQATHCTVIIGQGSEHRYTIPQIVEAVQVMNHRH